MMKLDVRSLCSRLPTYFSRLYSEYVFSEEMRLIRPLLEVEEKEEAKGSLNETLREEFYGIIEQLLWVKHIKVKEVLRKYADWTISQFDRVGVEK